MSILYGTKINQLLANTAPPDFVTQKTCILQLIDEQYFVSLCHLILGDTKCFLTMFVRKKKDHPINLGD